MRHYILNCKDVLNDSIQLKKLDYIFRQRNFTMLDHGIRTQVIAEHFGKLLGFSMPEQRRLSLFARFHDLGMLFIPNKILSKKSILAAEEWNLMRKHSEYGYSIATRIPELKPISKLILYHHERWDGQGYPTGLKEHYIPWECRILSIIDAFETMLISRPYSQPKGIKEIVEELWRGQGSQFDPIFIEIFIAKALDENFYHKILR